MIRKKIDAAHFLVYFSDYAEWDGVKHYIQLEGITLMQYEDGSCTYHRKNDHFEDIREIEMDREFVWKNRKVINAFLRGVKMKKDTGPTPMS
jgi:hypothetical protein